MTPKALRSILRCGAFASGFAVPLALVACGGTTTLNGAGASFPAAIYQRWFQALGSQGVRVNYQSVGSGAGVRQLISHTVDFAASDVPMKADEIAKVSQGVVQIPMTAGAIAVAYNYKGCDLKLSQAQLVDVFLGKINNFSQLGCAPKPIKVVHRSDGSGTTANFTAHLAAISPVWKNSVGAGKTVKWPTGIGAKGNEGVAANVNRVKGAIGYVEYAYVKKNNMNFMQMLNADGKYVSPDDLTFAAAAAGVDWFSVPGMGVSMVNAKGANSWPVSTASFILMYKDPSDKNLSQEALKFFEWSFKNGKQMAADLDYVALPDALTRQIRERVWSQIAK
jgi:phosphate transport system substrate-binding protein